MILMKCGPLDKTMTITFKHANLRSASSACSVCRNRLISLSRLRIDSMRYWYGCWHSSSKQLAFFSWQHSDNSHLHSSVISTHDALLAGATTERRKITIKVNG